MKQKANRSDLVDVIRDLAKATKPSARNLTVEDVEKIIQDVRREARARKANGRSPRRDTNVIVSALLSSLHGREASPSLLTVKLDDCRNATRVPEHPKALTRRVAQRHAQYYCRSCSNSFRMIG